MNILLATMMIAGESLVVYFVAQMNEESIIYVIDFQFKTMKVWRVDAPHLQIVFRNN